MFKPGNLYRHKSTLDIDLYLVREPEDHQDDTELEIKYWNRNSKCFQPGTEVVRIRKSELPMWEMV